MAKMMPDIAFHGLADASVFIRVGGAGIGAR